MNQPNQMSQEERKRMERNSTNTRWIENLTGVVLLALAAATASGQAPVIASFGQNGLLICTNLQPGSTLSVEWAFSVLGPWTNTWAGLDAVTADSNGAIRVSVPMFYRVRGLGWTNPALAAPPGMVLIPAGPFIMGDTLDGDISALPLHTNQVSACYIDQNLVTKSWWDQVKAWNGGNGYSYDYPGSGKATNHPVQTVSWYDVVKWCNARSQMEGRVPAYYTDATLTQVYQTGEVAPYVKWNAVGYRLPTEAEWEKAARGGASGQRFPWSGTNTITHSMANYYSSSISYAYDVSYDVSPTRGYHPTFAADGYPYTSPVGYFAPNGYGLYDRAGNVREWCWDWYDSYSSGSQTDPHGPSTGSYRVDRGGCWFDIAFNCRAADRRNSRNPSERGVDMGFRAVLPPGP